jgi:BlaI family penicillinase repressor
MLRQRVVESVHLQVVGDVTGRGVGTSGVERRRPAISETEMEVLRALWEHGPGTVRQLDGVLRRHGRRWAYTTVQTLLFRLQAKGYATSETRAVPHVFHAAVTREGLVSQKLQDLADQLCDGTATPLVMALVKGHRFSDDEIEQFRQLLDRMEEKKAKPRGRS